MQHVYGSTAVEIFLPLEEWVRDTGAESSG